MYGDDRYAMGLCPFHADRRPSLRVSRRGYRCFACGASGNLRQLLAELENAPVVYVEPTERTRGIFPPYERMDELTDMLMQAHQRLKTTPHLHWYLTQRRVTASIEPLYLGWKDNWYTIPIFNEHHDIIGATARAGSCVQTKRKYDTPYGQRPMLYIPDWRLFNSLNYVVVCFGILDAITLSQLGYPVVTPTAGQNSVRAEWFDNVRKPIYFVPDKGEHKAALQIVTKLGWRGKIIDLDFPDGITDSNDFVCGGLAHELASQINEVVDEQRRIKRAYSRQASTEKDRSHGGER